MTLQSPLVCGQGEGVSNRVSKISPWTRVATPRILIPILGSADKRRMPVQVGVPWWLDGTRPIVRQPPLLLTGAIHWVVTGLHIPERIDFQARDVEHTVHHSEVAFGVWDAQHLLFCQTVTLFLIFLVTLYCITSAFNTVFTITCHYISTQSLLLWRWLYSDIH